MARKVFYSFHYKNDIYRVNVVRNQYVTKGGEIASGIIDAAEFEEIKRKGDDSIKRWINDQLNGTSVTVVLIGSETLSRPYVQYEIQQSLERGNGVIGVLIHNIKDLRTGTTSSQGNIYTKVCSYNLRNLSFNEIADGIYDYMLDDGYNNLYNWIELSAEKHFNS